MEYNIKSVNDAKVKGKKVLVRLDFDVPISHDEIEDASRLVSGLETIKYLLNEGAIIILGGHMGRPDGIDKKYSQQIIAEWFANRFTDGEFSETKVGDFNGWKLSDNFYVLENLRFDKGEEENSEEYTKKLAETSEIYVNEAFAVAHRAHASTYGVAKLLPRYGGFHLIKEVKVLSKILNSPKRPLTMIIGGAKIETKLPLISNMHRFADFVLVGGELAEQTKVLALEQHKKINGQKAMLIVADVTPDNFDITTNSIDNFEQIIERSETVVWNGPMGFIEKGHDNGTIQIAKIINKSKAYKVIGGGDTIGFLQSKNLIDKFDFASVGGGAMLELLAGKKLPGLEALES